MLGILEESAKRYEALGAGAGGRAA
jgi:hypothetical protein